MKRETKFLISHRPYAVDLSSLKIMERFYEDGRPSYWFGRIDAVWFRRKSGVSVACIGSLWDYQDIKPETGVQFAEQHDDGRYGGSTEGRWDGNGYWGNGSLEKQNQHLAILRPMLENYSEVPAGFDGWWTFQ